MLTCGDSGRVIPAYMDIFMDFHEIHGFHADVYAKTTDNSTSVTMIHLIFLLGSPL